MAAQAGHAVVGALMPEYDPVTKISIVPRGGAGGLTFFAPSEERLESGLYSRSYLENQMSVAMGGRVAEELIFGPDNVTTGASNDFMQVGSCCSCLGTGAPHLCVRAGPAAHFEGAHLCCGQWHRSAGLCKLMCISAWGKGDKRA